MDTPPKFFERAKDCDRKHHNTDLWTESRKGCELRGGIQSSIEHNPKISSKSMVLHDTPVEQPRRIIFVFGVMNEGKSKIYSK